MHRKSPLIEKADRAAAALSALLNIVFDLLVLQSRHQRRVIHPLHRFLNAAPTERKKVMIK